NWGTSASVITVAAQQEPQALELLRCAGPAGLAELVPLLTADLVEGLGRPADHVKRVEAHDRIGGPHSDDLGDPRGAIGGDELEPGCPVVAEGVEERPDGVLGAALGRPDDPAGHVIAHDSEVLVA